MNDLKLSEEESTISQIEQSNNSSSEQDDSIISLLPRLPVISSVNSLWESLQIACCQEPAFTIPEHSPTHHLLQSILQLRLYLLPFKCGWSKLGRWLSFLQVNEHYHELDMQAQPHWYLALMFVNPNYQRQGVGSALLQPILARSRDENLKCYLVTFTDQGVKFYQKNGFDIIRKSQLLQDAPWFWHLIRDTSKYH